MSKLTKLWEKAKQLLGAIAVVYPALQILLKLKGIELPELPPDWSAGVQVGGAVALMQSEKVIKPKA